MFYTPSQNGGWPWDFWLPSKHVDFLVEDVEGVDIELLMIVMVLVVTKQLGWGTTQSKQLPWFFWQGICRNECS